MREADILIRWGGEEFLVVAPDTDTDSAAVLAERLRKTIAGNKFSGPGKITASFGIAQYQKGDRRDSLITDLIIDNMMGWHHSGFNIYCSKTLWPGDEEGIENLARYIIRAAFSSERMTYIPADESQTGTAKVIYESRDGRTSKIFDALDWLAQPTTHIPNQREQMVRYYGYYSNKAHGMRKKAGLDNNVPAMAAPALTPLAMKNGRS